MGATARLPLNVFRKPVPVTGFFSSGASFPVAKYRTAPSYKTAGGHASVQHEKYFFTRGFFDDPKKCCCIESSSTTNRLVYLENCFTINSHTKLVGPNQSEPAIKIAGDNDMTTFIPDWPSS